MIEELMTEIINIWALDEMATDLTPRSEILLNIQVMLFLIKYFSREKSNLAHILYN